MMRVDHGSCSTTKCSRPWRSDARRSASSIGPVTWTIMSADTRQCLVNLNSFRMIRFMRFLRAASLFPFFGTMTPNLAVLAFVSTERTFTLPFLCKKRPLRNTSVNCCARNRRALRGNVVPVMVYQTVRRLRPLARLAFNTCRPAFVAIRARKPCVRLRFRLLGWNVLFIARLVF